MNWKRLLKSIIGTVAIYGVLVAFLFIFKDIIDFLVYFPVFIGAHIVCSIAAGLLFKGELSAAVWSVVTVIFYVALWGSDPIFGVMYILPPLLIPFFLAKGICLSIQEDKKKKSGLEDEE